ncbi:uncharacterized protein LOC141914208 [Tubulanus polymorphus]|uniref:uncharacterized protein LOC141914208 n=1 Tax=Tubulanus polymorphus TaxID=672921 RepID=UPI003DA1F338
MTADYDRPSPKAAVSSIALDRSLAPPSDRRRNFAPNSTPDESHKTNEQEYAKNQDRIHYKLNQSHTEKFRSRPEQVFVKAFDTINRRDRNMNQFVKIFILLAAVTCALGLKRFKGSDGVNELCAKRICSLRLPTEMEDCILQCLKIFAHMDPAARGVFVKQWDKKSDEKFARGKRSTAW